MVNVTVLAIFEPDIKPALPLAKVMNERLSRFAAELQVSLSHELEDSRDCDDLVIYISYNAWNKEGLIVEPCFESLWATDQPVRLDCKDDKVYLITAENLPVGEAKSLITTTKNQLDQLTTALSCTSDANWSYTNLINYQTMNMEYIPFSHTGDYKELKANVSLYNKLNLNVIKAEQKGDNLTDIKTVENWWMDTFAPPSPL